MTEQRNINRLIADGLKEITGCEVVKSNLANTPIPPHPYISFSILNSETKKGTYSVFGEKYIPLTQSWSITIQSDDDDEAMDKAMLARDWLEETGRMSLNDHGIMVQKVTAIQNRDTMLTVAYEYRKGFDVVLSLMNRISSEQEETIETINIEKE